MGAEKFSTKTKKKISKRQTESEQATPLWFQ